jgi:hypothetical protein
MIDPNLNALTDRYKAIFGEKYTRYYEENVGRLPRLAPFAADHFPKSANNWLITCRLKSFELALLSLCHSVLKRDPKLERSAS